jgi:2-(1,2-epoxy-1,2-dihydrophenyl)acetyl-CoA isomerase
MDLLLRPRTVSAEEALAIGLATEVVADADFADRVRSVATALAAGPTLAYASIRTAVDHSATHTLAESLAVEAELMGRTGASTDHARAVEAFLGKQRPSFIGS